MEINVTKWLMRKRRNGLKGEKTMTKKQRMSNSITKVLLNNEIWLYSRTVTSFYRMRKLVRKEVL